MVVQSWSPPPPPQAFWGAYLVVYAGYGLGVRAALRNSVGLPAVLLVAAVCRTMFFWSQPVFENDFARYLWDGKVFTHGFNPYVHSPDAPVLAPLRDPGWDSIGYKQIPTVYPPLAEILFAVPWLTGVPLRVLFLAGDAAVVALLWLMLRRRGLPPSRLLLYAWHPLAIKEVVGNLHYEPVAIALALGAWWLGERRVLSGLSLGAAALLKPSAALLAPFWVRGRGWVAMAALVAAAYLPFWMDGGTAIFEGARIYAEQWRFNGGIYEGLAFLTGHPAARRLLFVAFLIGAACLWRQRDGTRGPALLLVLLNLLSPVANPWYVLWVVPFLCFEPLPSAMAQSALVNLGYIYFYTRVPVPWAMALQSVVVGALWLADIRITSGCSSRPNRKASSSPP